MTPTKKTKLNGFAVCEVFAFLGEAWSDYRAGIITKVEFDQRVEWTRANLHRFKDIPPD